MLTGKGINAAHEALRPFGQGRDCDRWLARDRARDGAYVAVNYVANEAAAVETLASIRAAGGDGEVVRFDVADAAAVTAAVDELAKRKGGLHIAVANAGVAIDGLLLRLRDEDLA